jgi:hypothetical protein
MEGALDTGHPHLLVCPGAPTLARHSQTRRPESPRQIALHSHEHSQTLDDMMPLPPFARLRRFHTPLARRRRAVCRLPFACLVLDPISPSLHSKSQLHATATPPHAGAKPSPPPPSPLKASAPAWLCVQVPARPGRGEAHDMLRPAVHIKVALPEPASKEADSLPFGPRLMSIASIHATNQPAQTPPRR